MKPRRAASTGWMCRASADSSRCVTPTVWIRRARSSVEPFAVELQDLYNTFGYILTEERTIQDATASHIDLEAFCTFLRRLGFDTDTDPQPDSLDDLRNRGVVAEIGGELRATLYGVLAFGRDPQRYPQTRSFRIECVPYAGDHRATDVLQVGRVGGPPRRAGGKGGGVVPWPRTIRVVRRTGPGRIATCCRVWRSGRRWSTP